VHEAARTLGEGAISKNKNESNNTDVRMGAMCSRSIKKKTSWHPQQFVPAVAADEYNERHFAAQPTVCFQSQEATELNIDEKHCAAYFYLRFVILASIRSALFDHGTPTKG